MRNEKNGKFINKDLTKGSSVLDVVFRFWLIKYNFLGFYLDIFVVYLTHEKKTLDWWLPVLNQIINKKFYIHTLIYITCFFLYYLLIYIVSRNSTITPTKNIEILPVCNNNNNILTSMSEKNNNEEYISKKLLTNRKTPVIHKFY